MDLNIRHMIIGFIFTEIHVLFFCQSCGNFILLHKLTCQCIVLQNLLLRCTVLSQCTFILRRYIREYIMIPDWSHIAIRTYRPIPIHLIVTRKSKLNAFNLHIRWCALCNLFQHLCCCLICIHSVHEPWISIKQYTSDSDDDQYSWDYPEYNRSPSEPVPCHIICNYFHPNSLLFILCNCTELASQKRLYTISIYLSSDYTT